MCRVVIKPGVEPKKPFILLYAIYTRKLDRAGMVQFNEVPQFSIYTVHFKPSQTAMNRAGVFRFACVKGVHVLVSSEEKL